MKNKIIVLFTLIFIISILLVGCNEDSNIQEEMSETIEKNTSKNTDMSLCTEKGGKWFYHDVPPGSEGSNGFCNMPTSDADKECTDSKQCESYCRAPQGSKVGSKVTGTCYEYKESNCMQEVKDGIADSEWCE